MADVKPKEEGTGGSGFGLLLLVLLGLLVLWFMQGNKSAQLSALFIQQSPLATTTHKQWLPFWNGAPGSGTGQQGTTTGQQIRSSSTGVSILDYSGTRASNPQEEYLVLYANQTNTGPVSISGWQLRSSRTGRNVIIGSGVATALVGQPTSPSPIVLAPGDSAIISTGRSPVGISFRENKCTGYLSQFQTFTPALSSRCPNPQAELASQRPDLANDQSCSFAIAGLPSCQALTQPPSNIPAECGTFMQEHFTYNACVTTHRTDADFAGTQWRVFLGQSAEFWNNSGDTVTVLDAEGKVVAATTY